MPGAVTFDFHNTLIHCDSWFHLETATLPDHVYGELTRLEQVPFRPEDHSLEGTYRALRREIMASGNELDAVAGTIETFRRAGIAVEPDDIAPIIDAAFLDLVVESSLVSGAFDLVHDLAATGVPIGVVSSAVHHDFLLWCLDRHGLSDAIAVVTSSAGSGYYKSNPRIYELTFDRLGVDIEYSVHIGDSYRFDHESAKSIGASTVWLNPTLIGAQATGSPPDLIVSDFALERDMVFGFVLDRLGLADAG